MKNQLFTLRCVQSNLNRGLVLLEYNLGLSATGYCYILAEIGSPLRKLSLAILSRFIDEIPATRQL